MSVFFYGTSELISQFTDKSLKIVIPKGIEDKLVLFEFYNKILMFPDYFGWNWDAFYECMITLPMIEENQIIVVHEDLPFENNLEQRRIYIYALREIVLSWAETGVKNILVFFPEECKNNVLEIEISGEF